MIEYTLEFLASNGVEEVFVFCCAHAAQITAYLEAERVEHDPRVRRARDRVHQLRQRGRSRCG